MHSLLKKVVVGSAVVGGVRGAVIPRITPAPTAELLAERQDPDALSLAQVLLTAVPESLRQIAATNLPAVSSLLWEEFLDDQRPLWFEELPWEIQNYLIRKFGPQTAWPTEAPTSGGFSRSDGLTATVTVTASTTDATAEPSRSTQSSETSDKVSQTGSGATESMEVPASTASSDRTSEPTASTISFATSHTTSSSQSSVSASSATKSHITSSTTLANPSETSSSSPTAEPEAPPASNSRLSRDQKIGLGVGIPFGLLGVTALFLACCMLCRRRKKKDVEGSIPPASPGFIPRFAFQDRSHENVEHHTSLIRDANRSTHDVGAAWDDEGVDPTENMPAHNPYAWDDLGAHSNTNAPAAATSMYTALDNEIDANNYSNVPVMMMNDPKPIMAPALYHTHSSNRARGKRTSYTSLHSVAEVSEPDEFESPILGRYIPSNHSPARNLMPAPAVPADTQIRRKPVPSSPPLPPLPTNPSPVATSPAAQAASHKLLRQTMPEHSGSSSSGLALTTSSGHSSNSSLAVHAEATSPISPISNRAPSNPFHYDSYVEDYGPEFQYGYVDVDDGLYGGNTSLSQYPEARRKNSKTEWPLRNMVGSNQRRRSSPIWERLSEE
ncbi:hypothetical protein P171DRAFT_519312 [Karstenula rhodostoma CBS 690.94]|uniref:Uncharacterized protein n=1 Tax=Karstenula rhodostoma CBS 690.94 TaxID=1392251 RepID=A0A9P4PQD5_9PLEO|nr:hypothetical protein P171DRAFT_519312 [Karstenula rhodostoma CBS 690.94]